MISLFSSLQDIFSNTPIGFIPLGSLNSLSPSLHLVSDNKVRYASYQYHKYILTSSKNKLSTG